MTDVNDVFVYYEGMTEPLLQLPVADVLGPRLAAALGFYSPRLYSGVLEFCGFDFNPETLGTLIYSCLYSYAGYLSTLSPTGRIAGEMSLAAGQQEIIAGFIVAIVQRLDNVETPEILAFREQVTNHVNILLASPPEVSGKI